MAAPTVNSVGPVVGTPGGSNINAVITAPATIATDDILVLTCLTNATRTLTSLPSGWAHVTGSPVSSTNGTNDATLNICWKRAVAGDVGATSYTFTLSAADYAEGAIVAVRSAINTGSPWDTGAGAPAFAHTSANATTAPAVSLTTQGADRLLWNGALNQTGGTPWTASSGFTKDFDTTGGGSFSTCTGYHKAQAVAGATGNVQPVCPASGQMVNFLGALLPVGGAAVAIPTNNPVRRRTQAPRRRPKATAVVPAQVIVPPFIPTQVKEARVLRGRLSRRGHAFSPVPAQVIVPPTIPTKGIQPRRLRGLLPRRGKVTQVVPTQVTVAPPSYPPLPVRVRLRGALVKRNRNVQVVPAQVTQINPPYPPVNLRVRVRGALSRRGRAIAPVPAQVTPPVVTWTPTPVRVRLRAALARRGRVVSPPATDTRVPLFARIRARLVPPRRGKTRTPVPPQIVVAPPAYPPQHVHRTRRGLRRRTHNVEGWMVGSAQQNCDTPRPFTGTTARPGSGTTAYSTATTARPGSGTTTRPDSGETDPPCG